MPCWPSIGQAKRRNWTRTASEVLHQTRVPPATRVAAAPCSLAKRERRTDCFGRTGRIPACISSVSTMFPPIYSVRCRNQLPCARGSRWRRRGLVLDRSHANYDRLLEKFKAVVAAGCHSLCQGRSCSGSFGTYGQMGGRNAIMSFQWYVPLLVMAVFASSVVMLEGWGMFVSPLAAFSAILLNRMSILAALGWFCGLLLFLPCFRLRFPAPARGRNASRAITTSGKSRWLFTITRKLMDVPSRLTSRARTAGQCTVGGY